MEMGPPHSVISPARAQRRRSLRLPRTFPRAVAVAEPISSAEAGFFGGGGFYLRVGMLAAVAIAVFGLLALRLWSLQVIQGPRYAHQAQRQTFRFVDLPAPRAPIFDVRGRPLAGTQGRLVLTADPDTLGGLDSHGVWHASPRGRELLRLAAGKTGLSASLLERRIRASVVRSPYAPAVVVPHLPRPVSYVFDERASDFPGLHVVALPSRSYPQGAFGSEFLGLLGEIGPKQLAARRGQGARPGEIVGQSGVEQTYDRLLNGGLQRNRVAVDSLGRAVGRLRPLGYDAPRGGLQLTIDARLQRDAERAIRNGIAYAHAAGHWDANAGAAVAIDPRDGSIRALASYPVFNQVAAANDPGYLSRLIHADSGPGLFNRAIQGIYPTGSTFKPIVAEAALSAGLISPYSYMPCTGSYTVGNIVFHNVEPGVNASLNLPQALAVSCDTWFYRLGEKFYYLQQRGDLAMQRWAKQLGLGHSTGLDVPGETSGVVPTPGWLKKAVPADPIWYPGQSVNLSIGQGYLAVTPLQLAVAYAALANGGKVVRPHVARAVLGPHNEVLKRLRFPPRTRLRMTGLGAIHQGLFDAANSPGGTSFSIFGSFPVKVDGKTGTAEAPYGSDHSWYASWAPAANPRLVVVVLIEHGGFGAEAAAPAARDIYQAFFGLDRNGRVAR